MEEPPEENLCLLDERDAPMLKQPGTMHQMEGSRTYSMKESRSCTPKPQGAGMGSKGRPGTISTITLRKGEKRGKGPSPCWGGPGRS